MTSRRTSWLTALGSVLLLAGILAGLVNRNILDGDRFAHGVDNVRREPAVSEQVGQAMANRLFAVDPNLIALRPLVEASTLTLAASSAFSPIVRGAARQLHTAFTTDHGGVVLRLADVGAVLTGTLRVIAPGTAARVPPNLDVTLAAVGSHSFAAGLIHLTRIVGLLAWLLPVLALVAFVAALGLSTNRREGTARLGWAVAAVGTAIALVGAAGALAVSFVDTHSLRGALIAGGWRQFAGVLWAPAAATVAAGAFLIAASQSRIPRLNLAIAARQAWLFIARPYTGGWSQFARGAALAGIGFLVLFRSGFTLRVLAVLVGLPLLLAGVGELVAAFPGSRPERPALTWRRARRPAAVGAAVLVLGGLVAFGAAPANRAVSRIAETKACNGHIELCDRRYTNVVYPATHNAMAAADDPGWFIPEQPTGIIGQLNAGIRVLLIDAWYGQRTQRAGLIATAPGSHEQALAVAEKEFGPEVVASALRLRNAVTTTPTGPIEPYLCHGLCEIGATQWEPVMARVRAWLAAHPREVVTLFIEDYVSPADTANVFRDAGLLPYVHEQQAGKAWPTLEQMIDSGRRLVVLMERRGGGKAYPWLLQGFDYVQDTPFFNPSVADLGCTPNRGTASNPLLLVNHWLNNFNSLVTDSRRVNAYGILEPILVKCQKERGQLPNFIAVNYFNEGDLFRAVDTLNGVH
jgi:hypothetical protein